MAKKGEWIKRRKKYKKYPKTDQQRKIAEAGEEIKKKCKGKKGEEFHSCRMEVLRETFKKS